MSEKRYYWLKLKKDFFASKEIKKLRKIAGGDTFTVIYLKMQLKSLQDDGKLYFDNVESNFAEELALDLDEDIENVKITLGFLFGHGMIETSDDYEYLLPDVHDCTGSETAGAKRVRKHREKRKLLLRCNEDETSCNVEIEKEKEKEIDKGKKSRFAPPSLEQVREYCKERSNNIDPEQFIDYYESNGWMIGKNKMKDWKAAVRTWEKRDKEKSPRYMTTAEKAIRDMGIIK